MSHPTIIQNLFDPKTTNQLLRKLQFVSFDQSPQLVINDIEQVTSDEYLWAVGKSPAYFVQYQIKSAAVFKLKNLVLLVWKPKYIEYPSMVQLPELKDKKPNNLTLTYLPQSKTTEQTNKYVSHFIQGFYATYFHSDNNFQTNLVTHMKHLISRVTKHMYWHVLLDDTDSLFVTNMDKMDNVCKIRIQGMKEGYDKTLLMVSYKGTKGSLFRAAKNKWIQLLSFLSMLLIFFTVTACSAQDTEGICGYRNEMTMAGTGIMLALIGVRYVKDKGKNKSKGASGKKPVSDKKD